MTSSPLLRTDATNYYIIASEFVWLYVRFEYCKTHTRCTLEL